MTRFTTSMHVEETTDRPSAKRTDRSLAALTGAQRPDGPTVVCKEHLTLMLSLEEMDGLVHRLYGIERGALRFGLWARSLRAEHVLDDKRKLIVRIEVG